jgi:hypothetical protein
MADVDLSIFRAEPGSGQAQKKFLLFRAEKILPMIIPLDASALNFRAGPGLGRAARAFYNVKQLKTAFRAKKNFTGFKISTHARPVRFAGGPGAGRARARPAGWVGPGSKCSVIGGRKVGRPPYLT